MNAGLILFIVCSLITLLASRRTLRPVEAAVNELLGRPLGERDDTPSFFDVMFGGFSMGYVLTFLTMRFGGFTRVFTGSPDAAAWAVTAIQLLVAGILASFFLKIYWRERLFLTVMTIAGFLTALLMLS